MSALKDLDRVTKNINKAIRNALTTKIMRKLGDFTADKVRVRTRLGYGIKKNSDKRISLRGMRMHSVPYSKWRKKNKGKLSRLTSPARHNLTLTGQMLESIKTTKAGRFFAMVSVSGVRTDGQKNELIAKENQNRGWSFMGLTRPEQRQLIRYARTIIKV